LAGVLRLWWWWWWSAHALAICPRIATFPRLPGQRHGRAWPGCSRTAVPLMPRPLRFPFVRSAKDQQMHSKKIKEAPAQRARSMSIMSSFGRAHHGAATTAPQAA